MEFIIETTVDRRAMTALSRASRRTLGRRRSIAVHIFGWAVVGLILLLSLLLWLGSGSIPWFNLLVGLVMLATLRREDRLNGAIGLRQVLPGSRQVTARFTEEDYLHTTPVSESRWHYDQIRAVCETEDYFLLLLSRRHGQVYSKAGFTRGDPEAFRTFIAGRTGLPVQRIR